jgi:ATP/maltotriose-dependent transcriptional regulator MalT
LTEQLTQALAGALTLVSALALLHTPQPAEPRAVLVLLIHELVARRAASFALVLDDYHVITAPSIHQALSYLVEYLPEQMHLVIATRSDPPLPLARLRVRGQVTEVRAADLRFETWEAETFLRTTMRLSLSSDEVAVLQSRTEGWIAGLQLAALSLRGRSDSSAFLRAFSGSHRFVLEYLSEEVLSQQSQPALVSALHRRASTWYEEHGMVLEAVRHALAAPDVEQAARLIAQYSLAVVGQGQYFTLLGWLEALPESLVRGNARLSLAYAMALRVTNQLAAVEARLQDAERGLQAETPEAQTGVILGWVTGMRALLALSAGDVARCAILARQALELLPETMTIMRAAAMLLMAHEYLASGEVTSTTERLAVQAVARARPLGNLSITLRSLTNLARVQVLQGRLQQALATYEEAVRALPAPQTLPALVGGPAYYFGLGDLLREWNKLEATERLLSQGMDRLQGKLTVDADLAALGYLTLARLKQARGDSQGALVALHGCGSHRHALIGRGLSSPTPSDCSAGSCTMPRRKRA